MVGLREGTDLMAPRDEAKFDKALDKAGIALDARDRAAALPVLLQPLPLRSPASASCWSMRMQSLAAPCLPMQKARSTTSQRRNGRMLLTGRFQTLKM